MSVTIDCQTCPVRGRHCGDCIVPVLGRVWLADPQPVTTSQPAPQRQERAATLSLDFEETEAVEAFARAGLISRTEASRARASSTAPAIAVG